MSPSWLSTRSQQVSIYDSCTSLSTDVQSNSAVLAVGSFAPGLSDPLSSTIARSSSSASPLSSDVAAQFFLTPPVPDTFPPTGNLAIDALLSSNRTYWNTSTNGGIITYSFLSNEAASFYYGAEQVSEVSDAIKNNVRQVLASLESFINVNFVEVADLASSYGTLRYMFSNGPDYAYAYLPSENPTGGDVHLASTAERSTNNAFSGSVGSYGYETLIHETLHALGLKHSGNYNGSGPGIGPFLAMGEDNNTNTVMTYNNAGADAITPMAYDIRALQYLYGARTNHPINSTYSFSTVYNYTLDGQPFGNTTTALKQTIWDSGGIDTLDFSGLSAASSYRFDLREGGMITTQAAYNSSVYRDRGGQGISTTSTFGTAIAYNTIIENLINSPGSDYIIANGASNLFQGYTPGRWTGNDIYEGANSFDVIDLSSYTLTDLSTTINGNNFMIGLGATNGSIQINNYFASHDNLRLLIGSNYYVYTVDSGWQFVPVSVSVTAYTPPITPETTIAATGGLTAIAPTNSSLAAALSVPERCQCALCTANAIALNQLGTSSLSDRIMGEALI